MRRRSGRVQLRARLRSLAFVEAANVVIVPGAALLATASWGVLAPGVALGAAAIAVSLAAGATYWFRRARGPVGIGWCRACEAGLGAAAVLAGLAAVWSAYDAVATGAVPGPVAGLLLALFAAAEVVNYRFVQISAGGWLRWFRGRIRRPHLALDLRRAARQP